MLEGSGDINSPFANAIADRELQASQTEQDEYDNNHCSTNNTAAWLSKIITAVGNFNVQYNFQVISVVLIIMSSDVCTSTEENCRSVHL